MAERAGLGGGHRQMVVDQATAEAILERLGWTFHRIRGSAFYRDPHAALSGLWDQLENLGTQPRAVRPGPQLFPPSVSSGTRAAARARPRTQTGRGSSSCATAPQRTCIWVWR